MDGQELILPMTDRHRESKSPNRPLCKLLGLAWFTDLLSQASNILGDNYALVCKICYTYKAFSPALFHSILPLAL